MEAMSHVLDNHVWTREERDALPDDGNRYELIDGALVVTPSPRWWHQEAAFELAHLLRQNLPAGMRVLMAPMDVNLAVDTVVQPDVLVIDENQRGAEHIDGRPLLAVEVLSPSSQTIDRTVKFDRYRRAGTPSFWLVEPASSTGGTPSLTAFELDGEQYRQVAHVVGDQSWTAHLPFEVTITPAALRTWPTLP